MWDPPKPGLEPVSPALAGSFSTTAPPGKPPFPYFFIVIVEVAETEVREEKGLAQNHTVHRSQD